MDVFAFLLLQSANGSNWHPKFAERKKQPVDFFGRLFLNYQFLIIKFQFESFSIWASPKYFLISKNDGKSLEKAAAEAHERAYFKA